MECSIPPAGSNFPLSEEGEIEAMPSDHYPRNKAIRNGRLTSLYLYFLRRRLELPGKILGHFLNCDIPCRIPERLFLPHPVGIVIATGAVLGNDTVLLQQVTLGCRNPYTSNCGKADGDPILEQGVYVGPGAKVLGPVRIGAWSVIGANAVITIDVPPGSIAVGYNRILDHKTDEMWRGTAETLECRLN
jgi:serine acetyltransferase